MTMIGVGKKFIITKNPVHLLGAGFFISFLLLATISQAQIPIREEGYGLGLEYNYYPAGHIFGIEYERTFGDNRIDARIAVNFADRKDFSKVNDHESGWGPGFSLGYRRFFRFFYTGIRADIWSLSIDWEDANDVPTSGNSTVVVFQPTIPIGLELRLSQEWRVTAAVANGFEINAFTSGAEVAQGWITLLQFRLIHRFE